MEQKGKAWKYGDNINTDIISPPAYMEMAMEDAARYAMSVVDPDFASGGEQSGVRLQPGDCAADPAHPGHPHHHCQKLCPYLLPQLHQSRPARHRVPGDGENLHGR